MIISYLPGMVISIGIHVQFYIFLCFLFYTPPPLHLFVIIYYDYIIIFYYYIIIIIISILSLCDI